MTGQDSNETDVGERLGCGRASEASALDAEDPLFWVVVRFEVQLEDAAAGPALTAAAVRGALGWRLRRISCATGQPTCDGCAVSAFCSYHEIFETPNTGAATRLGRVERAPHPFVIRTPEVQGDNARIEVSLIGVGLRHLPLFVQAIDRMGEGFGDARVKYRLCRVAAQTPAGEWVPLFEARGRVPIFRIRDLQLAAPRDVQLAELEFLSPARLTRAGEPVRRLDWRVFADRLLHRMEILSSMWCGGEASAAGRTALRRSMLSASIQRDDTQYVTSERHSSRQRRLVPLDGLVGSWSVAGDLDPLVPYLLAARHLGVGKGTSAGCGEVDVRGLYVATGASPQSSDRRPIGS